MVRKESLKISNSSRTYSAQQPGGILGESKTYTEGDSDVNFVPYMCQLFFAAVF